MSKAPKTYINIDGDVREASSLTVPQDRIFRGSWQLNGVAVEEVMEKAVEIQKDNLRQERKPLLEALDVETMKALETGGDVAAIAAQKQALRDVTDDPRLAGAANTEELKALSIDNLVNT